MSHVTRTTRPPPNIFLDPTLFKPKRNVNKNDLWREKTELVNSRLCKVTRAKVLLELEFDTEDQVLFIFIIILYYHIHYVAKPTLTNPSSASAPPGPAEPQLAVLYF